jgi:hypothetical protein
MKDLHGSHNESRKQFGKKEAVRRVEYFEESFREER